MNYVDKWLSDVQNTKELVNRVLNYCHKSGLKVVDDGVGCPCVPHRAFREAAAEDLATRAKKQAQETQVSLDEALVRAEKAEKELADVSLAVTKAQTNHAEAVKAATDAELAAQEQKKASQVLKQALAKANGRIADLETHVKAAEVLEAKISAAQKALK